MSEEPINKKAFVLLIPAAAALFFFIFLIINSIHDRIQPLQLSDNIVSLETAQKNLDFISDILYSGQTQENFSQTYLLSKIKGGYSNNIAFISDKTEDPLEKRILALSDSVFAVIDKHLKGELLQEKEAADLKAQIKILKRVISLDARKLEKDMTETARNSFSIRFNLLYLALCLIIILFVALLFIIAGHSSKISRFAGLSGKKEMKNIDEVIKFWLERDNAGMREIVSLKKDLEREGFIQKRYRDILNSIPVGIMVTDQSDKILFINSVLGTWFSVKEELIGEHISKFIQKAGLESLSAGKIVKNDSVFWINARTAADVSFLIFQDISEQENIASRLLSSERLISIGEIASKVTHEIRNPLSTIKLNSEYLAENIGKLSLSELSTSLNLIIKEVIRLEEITNRYMGMVRYRGDEEMERGVKLPGDLDEFIAFHNGELEKRGIELTVSNSASALLSLSISSFREIFLNLIKNAWEELENSGKIAVISIVEKDIVKIFVDDSGKGIPEAEREKIFKNFYTNKPGGTGIGLSHSRKLAIEAGGKLYAERSPLGGARFVVEIPIKKS